MSNLGWSVCAIATVSIKRCAVLVGITFISASAAQADLSDINCQQPDEVCVVTSLGLPLRALTKPQSNIYLQPDETSQMISSMVPAFQPYYVFEALDVNFTSQLDATGWYRVGPNFDEVPTGYIKASDVVLWKQALAVSFTNPGTSERQPVLMYSDIVPLEATVAAASADQKTAADLYDKVLGGNVPPEVLSREPNGWVDIDKNFYLMPIVSYQDMSLYWPGGDLKAVQIAAITNAARSEQKSACNLQEADANDCIREQSGSGGGTIGLDAVFVIDTTSSMQPHIDAVRNAVREAARSLSANNASEDLLRLGVIGYRDSVEQSPGLEYDAQNFTPDELLGVDSFIDLMSSGKIRAATVGSEDYPEDVFAGLKLAIEETKWRDNVAKVIILIGDASGHPANSGKNSSGLNERSVRALADEDNIYIASLYIGEESDSDFSKARPQFSAMAAGDGETSSAFARISPSLSDDSEGGGLESGLRAAIDEIIGLLYKRDFSGVMSATTDAKDGAGQAIVGAVRAAVVDYIGKDATPPSNMVVWALDRDITEFRKKSFDIRVMVTRSDVIDMMELLKSLLSQLEQEQVGGGFVFLGAQTQSGSTSVDLGIAESERIDESKMTPQWAKGLPYKSELLSMTLGEFNQLSPDDRTNFETRLKALVDFYDTILNKPAAWEVVNENAGPDGKVYMLDLSNLP